MKKLLFCFIVICTSLSLSAQSKMPPQKGNAKSVEKAQVGNYTYTIIPGINKTWGYNILVEKRLYIHQPSIPGLPGNEGFKTKAAAEKVAKLVIEKIKKGEMPPTVLIEEMKKLKVL